MPFVLSHKGPGEQPHAKLWTFPPAMVQMIPNLEQGRRASSRLLQGASRSKGRHLLLSEKTVKTWKEESVSDAESGWSGVSDNSSTDSECTDVEASSVASDQDRFDTAYDAFRDLADDLYDIDLRRYPRGVARAGVPLMDGQEKLQEWCICPELGLLRA